MIDFRELEFDDVVDYVAELVGKDFKKAVDIANDILENPSGYTGPQATRAAALLAAYRVRMSPVESYYKYKSVASKSVQDRLVKDALIVMRDALVELINALKLSARTDHAL